MDKKNGYAGDRDFDIKSLSENSRNPRDDALKKEISDFSNMKPEVVAQLIRSWMQGEDKE